MTKKQLVGLSIAALMLSFGVSEGQSGPRIGLVHGIFSDSTSWDTTKPQLLSAFYPNYVDTVFTPNPSWPDHFVDQRQTMLDNYSHVGWNTGFLGPLLGSNTILYGHSNGGIVSRFTSHRIRLLGVTTLASPQHGAPLLDHYQDMFYWLTNYVGGSLAQFVDDVWNYGRHLDSVVWEIINNYQDWMGYVDDGLFYAAGMIEANNHVMDDMHFYSPFITNDLNGDDALTTERDSIGTPQAIVVTTANWYQMGLTRLMISNNDADNLGAVVYGAAYDAMALSGDMIEAADPDDDDYDQEIAVATDLWTVGWYLLEIDDAYCTAVTDRNEMGCVDASDEIVPLWSQNWGLVTTPVQVVGPSHTGETNDYTTARTVIHSTYGIGPP